MSAEAGAGLRNIADLARLAGVSTGTVSRALSGSGLISEATRTRIRALADAHGFQPNPLARNLRIRRAGAVGVVIPLAHDTGQHISDPFFITMLGHLADALTERGHDLLLRRETGSGPEWLIKVADGGRVDGVLVIGQSDQAATLDLLAARYRPLVAWGGHEEGQRHCSVGTDNRRGGVLVAEHLLRRGCRRIAFLGDPRAREIGQRLEGVHEAMVAAGRADTLTVVPTHLVGEAAYREVRDFLRSGPPPDGLVAASDVTAMSALQALAEAGLSVPGDVRITGFDDLPVAQQTIPRLTTVRQDFARGAALMVKLLFERMEGAEPGSVVMPPELVVRDSS